MKLTYSSQWFLREEGTSCLRDIRHGEVWQYSSDAQDYFIRIENSVYVIRYGKHHKCPPEGQGHYKLLTYLEHKPINFYEFNGDKVVYLALNPVQCTCYETPVLRQPSTPLKNLWNLLCGRYSRR